LEAGHEPLLLPKGTFLGPLGEHAVALALALTCSPFPVGFQDPDLCFEFGGVLLDGGS